tara:strand:+ start:4695 stop:4862 length:168 start_codon:yes stop_codon:yes gene_type:complete
MSKLKPGEMLYYREDAAGTEIETQHIPPDQLTKTQLLFREAILALQRVKVKEEAV